MKTGSPALVAFLNDASANPADLSVWVVDLYTFTLVNGNIFRWCSGDQPVTVGGNTYGTITPANANNPAIKRSKVNSTIGLSVDDLIVEIFASPSAMANGTQLLASLQRGDFDGAAVLVQRMIMPGFYGDTSLGTLVVFSGTVGPISDIGATSAKITVKALTELLNVMMPRNLYQPGCMNTLYDSACTLLKSTFRVSSSAKAGATAISIPTNLTNPGGIAAPASAPTLSSVSQAGVNIIPTVYYAVVTYVSALGETLASAQSSLAVGANLLLRVASPAAITGATGYNVYVGLTPGGWQRQNGTPISIGTNWTMAGTGPSQGAPPPFAASNGYFSQGVITFTSGANNGLSRVVTGYDANGTVHILISLPSAPANGDTFTILPGCDKQMSTCKQKFNNLVNFRGHPFVPQPEAVI